MRSLSLIACLALAQRIAGQQIWDIWYEALNILRVLVLIFSKLGKLLGTERTSFRTFRRPRPSILSHLEQSDKLTLWSMTAKYTRLLQGLAAV